MENSDMRNMLLSELIDRMHGRLADKMYPPMPEADDQPAVTAISPEAMAEDKSVDTDSDVEEPNDDEINELLGE
jgi:hypothetical protein